MTHRVSEETYLEELQNRASAFAKSNWATSGGVSEDDVSVQIILLNSTLNTKFIRDLILNKRRRTKRRPSENIFVANAPNPIRIALTIDRLGSKEGLQKANAIAVKLTTLIKKSLRNYEYWYTQLTFDSDGKFFFSKRMKGDLKEELDIWYAGFDDYNRLSDKDLRTDADEIEIEKYTEELGSGHSYLNLDLGELNDDIAQIGATYTTLVYAKTPLTLNNISKDLTVEEPVSDHEEGTSAEPAHVTRALATARRSFGPNLNQNLPPPLSGNYDAFLRRIINNAPRPRNERVVPLEVLENQFPPLRLRRPPQRYGVPPPPLPRNARRPRPPGPYERRPPPLRPEELEDRPVVPQRTNPRYNLRNLTRILNQYAEKYY